MSKLHDLTRTTLSSLYRFIPKEQPSFVFSRWFQTDRFSHTMPDVLVRATQHVEPPSVMLFDSFDFQELYGTAFLAAITACAGLAWAKPEPDKEKIDHTFLKDFEMIPSRRHTDGQINVQVKTHKCPNNSARESFSYTIDELKLYNWLRSDNIQTPRYLFVVTLPAQREELILQDRSLTQLHHAAFYMSIRGWVALPVGQETKRIQIPYANLLTPEVLYDLVERTTLELS